MKKQIFILTIFTLALLFAGTMQSYGQITYIKHVQGTAGCATAIPLTCATAEGELNPTPGMIYNYAISTDPTAVQSVHWFVTNDPNVIVDNLVTTLRDPGDGTGNYVLLGEVGVYNVATQTAKDVDISWQWFNGTTTEVLLVAYVKGAAGCSDNVEVWRIEPTFAFTLDLLSMYPDGSLEDVTGALTPASECVSAVESATYTGGANLTMDYGENWVFFSVNAANFTDSWMPNMTASITGASTIGAIEWAYPTQAVLPAGTWNDATTVPIAVDALSATGVVGPAGECIVVRVEIQHGNNPTPLAAATETVTLNVNGIMFDAANVNYTNLALRDVDEGTPCVQDYTDTRDYTLLARPQITEVNPAPVSFEPKN